ncbi:MAG: FkbM family methyltransferase [Chloroflexi bacterium]|nr:FkbM family methyltransferase [Chloroflexota bacterium]MCL5274166.1 FkbM family methyltransferase [Chloroflexota bacterium]
MNPSLFSKRIDLVDFDDINLFMFMDDNLYDVAIQPYRKNRSLAEYQKQIHTSGYPPSKLNPSNIRQDALARDGVYVLLDHLWDNQVDFTILDIGSFIGDFSCKVGNFIRTFGKTTQVISFDPTIAGALVNYNIELNGLQAIVKHEDLAIAEHDGLVMFSYIVGNTDSASIINSSGTIVSSGKPGIFGYLSHFVKTPARAKLPLLRNFITRRVRSVILGQNYSQSHQSTLIAHSANILSYLSKHDINTNLLVKIDIEGHDQEVIKDLTSLLPTRMVNIIAEFNPGFYPTIQASSEFLFGLSNEFYIFDIFYSPNPAWFRLIDPTDITEFAENVRHHRKYGYTDLLLLDKRIPQSDKIMTRLSSLSTTVEEYVL